MYFFLINWIVSRNFNTAHYIGCDGERDKTLKKKKKNLYLNSYHMWMIKN